MGILKTAIAAGAAYGIVKTGVNAIERNNQAHQNQQPAMKQYESARNTSGYLHQPYCNGNCNHQCHQQATSARSIGNGVSNEGSNGQQHYDTKTTSTQ
jgi:hypothetical protein